MTASFPEIRASALAQLPPDAGLDGELVVWEWERLMFERLQQRLARRGKGAFEAAEQWPAHYVAFDLLQLGDAGLTGWTYRRRRAALEALFAEYSLSGPMTLCPVDHRSGRGRTVAEMGGGRAGRLVLQEAGRALPSGALLVEVQGAGHDGGHCGGGHRLPGCPSDGPAEPLRPRRAPAVHRSQHAPRSTPMCTPSCSPPRRPGWTSPRPPRSRRGTDGTDLPGQQTRHGRNPHRGHRGRCRSPRRPDGKCGGVDTSTV